MKKMLHKIAIKYVKKEYTLIFIYYVIRFGVIRFGLVRIPKLRYSVFWYFTRFGRSLALAVVCVKKIVILLMIFSLLQKSRIFLPEIYPPLKNDLHKMIPKDQNY